MSAAAVIDAWRGFRFHAVGAGARVFSSGGVLVMDQTEEGCPGCTAFYRAAMKSLTQGIHPDRPHDWDCAVGMELFGCWEDAVANEIKSLAAITATRPDSDEEREREWERERERLRAHREDARVRATLVLKSYPPPAAAEHVEGCTCEACMVPAVSKLLQLFPGDQRFIEPPPKD